MWYLSVVVTQVNLIIKTFVFIIKFYKDCFVVVKNTQLNKTEELLTHSVLRGERIHNVAQDKRTPTQHSDKRYFI